MSSTNRIRKQKLIRRAEGFLELDMPDHALETLVRWDDPNSLGSHADYLRGEAYRSLERYDEAVVWLQRTADGAGNNIHVLLALGWCFKRTDQLASAIAALDRALEIDPDAAIVHYNLACYWSLAGSKGRALKFLRRALQIDTHYRDLVSAEADFDFLRDDPEFVELTSMVA
jgi:tetratricopeptide (TPR) repeat protein